LVFTFERSLLLAPVKVAVNNHCNLILDLT
jgi:hypothetical protein